MSARRLRSWRRRTVAAGIAGGVLCAASVAWSVAAARPVELRLPEVAAPDVEPEPAGPEPLPAEAFAKRLTFPRPPAPPPEAAEAAYGDERFALLGIVESEDGLVAAVHDRMDDRVHFVKEGDRLGGSEVKRVAPRLIEIADSDAGTARRFELKAPRPQGSGTSQGGGA